MRRMLITLGLMTVVFVLSFGAARAGGSWIEFPGDRALVGDTVTGVGHFGEGQQLPVSAGPWFAILRPNEPGVEEVPLGPVTIGESNFYGWKATTTFTVPDVPVGEYWVDVVNAQGEGVGDLIGGFLLISHTPAEAKLWVSAGRAESRLAQRDRAIDRGEELQEQLRSDLADRDATIDRQAERLADVTGQAALLEADLAALRADEATSAPTPVWPIALAGAGVVALTAAAFALGRRSLGPDPAGRTSERASSDADAGDGREAFVDREPGPAGIG
jgi:hypothetical protein